MSGERNAADEREMEMSQSAHWAKDRNFWWMLIGGVFVVGGIIGALVEGIPSALWIFVGIGIGWQPLYERLKAPKWTQWVFAAIMVCGAVYLVYSLIHRHR